jgi:hypothetical protein
MSTKLKGQNLRIFLDGQVITAALNCQFRIKSTVRDNSTKDTTGDWAQNEIVDMGWEVTADSAVWTGEGPGKNTKDLLDYRGVLVDVELAVTNGEYNAEKGGAIPVAKLNAHAPEIINVGDEWFITTCGWRGYKDVPNKGCVSIAKLEWK